MVSNCVGATRKKERKTKKDFYFHFTSLNVKLAEMLFFFSEKEKILLLYSVILLLVKMNLLGVGVSEVFCFFFCFVKITFFVSYFYLTTNFILQNNSLSLSFLVVCFDKQNKTFLFLNCNSTNDKIALVHWTLIK